MKLSEFDYELPKNLIAQKQARPRDSSRLLVLDKNTGKLEHKHFYDLASYLEAGDVLVLNDTKVFPARLIGKKKYSGGKIEVFLLKKIIPQPPLSRGIKEVWQCLVGGKVRREGMEVEFGKGLEARILKRSVDGTWEVSFNMKGKKMTAAVNRIGEVPLPPYIKKNSKKQDARNKTDYQTIFADDRKTGSVAAPTAGLHFTPSLLGKLEKMGVQAERVTLHVGLGTFASVKTDTIEEHKMHSEWASVSKPVLSRIIKAKKAGRRIIAVGTTSARTLETALAAHGSADEKPSKGFSGWTDIFIYPGYRFKAVDALITNFHLPKSTLLMLVSALAGKDNIKKAYKEAIRLKYRFFSYGDAMFIR